MNCSKIVVLDHEYPSFKSSSVYENSALGNQYNSGKLDSIQAWSAGANDMNQWMEIDVLHAQPIAGIVTQGVYMCVWYM
jgi:hypothetical protein